MRLAELKRALRVRIRGGGVLVQRLVIFSFRYPGRVVGLWAGYLLVFGIAGFELEIETSISSLLDTSSDTWSTYQRTLDLHGSDEFVAVFLESETPFDTLLLERIVLLTKRLEDIAGVTRVDGLASVALIQAREHDGVVIDPPLFDGVPETESGKRNLRSAIARDPIAPGAYISKDQRAIAITAILDENVVEDRYAIVSAIEKSVGPDAAISGVPIFRTRIHADTQRESSKLLPFTLAVMALMLFLVFRSIAASILPLAVGGVGSVAVLGALGFTGTPLSLSTLILPTVLLALGCAYAMHILTAACDVTSRSALENRLRSVAVPVAVSGFTTALGFLSVSTSDIGAIRELAMFGAFGVATVTVACLSLLPALISKRSISFRQTKIVSWLKEQLPRQIAFICAERTSAVVTAWALIAIFAVMGIRWLEVSTNIVSWYPHESKIRSDYTRIRDALSGISPVSIFIESTGERSSIEPDVIEAIDTLGSELEARSDVGKVLGINHPIRAMRNAYLGRNSGLPTTLDESEQYLLLLESEEQIWDLISRDRRSARILLRVDDNASDSIIDISRWAESWWNDHGPPDFRAQATGIMFEFAKTNQAIVRTQIMGLTIALLGMAVVLWLILGSLAGALVALLPNLIPLGAAYGAMGLAGVPLDAGTACLGSLALGIAVDDTVHVAANWSRERSSGAPMRKSLEAAMSSVMPALFLSSVCVVVGFAVLGTSELGLVRNLGLVTCSVVLICWAADLTLLPVLLGLVESRWSDNE